MTSRYITPGQKEVLRYFIEGLDQYKGKLRFNNILDAKWSQIVAGYIPPDLQQDSQFQREYQELSDGWRMSIGQGLLERTERKGQYQLTSKGEDYILEVLWKDE